LSVKSNKLNEKENHRDRGNTNGKNMDFVQLNACTTKQHSHIHMGNINKQGFEVTNYLIYAYAWRNLVIQ
jgi:hypothetical protein